MNKTQKKKILIDIVILVVIAAIVAVSMAFATDVELLLGLGYYDKVPVAPAEGEGEEPVPVDKGALYVHFVDVGQGDCTVIELPDGKTMVIDGGENDKNVENAIQKFIDDTLPEDFKYFDYAILTHPDSDHCGSLDYVLNKYPARFAYRPNVEAVGTDRNPYVDPGKTELTANAVKKNTAAYANSIAAMYQTTDDFTSVVYITDPADEAQTISGGTGDDAYTFTFYSPLADRYTGEGQWNNYSPVMILEYKGIKYAMSGDAEEKNLEQFVDKVRSAATDGVTDKYDAFDDGYCVNVIKAGHHGSQNATTLDYLDAITSPSGAAGVYCVISCGAGNSYGHPHQAALDRYAQIGVADDHILRTDIAGDITLAVKNDGTGAFKLFYGDKAATEFTEVYRYKTVGGFELKWSIVGWAVFAVIAAILIVHIALAATGVLEKSEKSNAGDAKPGASKTRGSSGGAKKKTATKKQGGAKKK